MDVIDIGASSLEEPVSININDNPTSSPKVSFGSGIELLMNDKNKSSSADNIKLDLGDLNDLENELNDLSSGAQTKQENSENKDTKTLSGMASDLFGLGGFTNNNEPSSEPIEINLEPTDSNIGQATNESIGNSKTWDGFSKMNEIPSTSTKPTMNEREKRRKKRMMLKKMEDWFAKGQIKQSTDLNMDSSYEEIEDEYETIMDEKRKKDSIKLQGWWFMTFVNSIEYGNAVFNPFDLNLDGWGEQIGEDIDSYEEIFSELHEKYKGGKMAPELSLLLRLGFSAAVVNFSNKALSSATPGFNDVIKQSPELMKMFTDATVNSMSQQSPSFEFANNLMQDQMNRPRGPPPPAPVETKNQPPPQRPGMTFTDTPGNRPDINAGRGTMFKEDGIDVKQTGINVNESTKTIRPSRPEMKGPQSGDIDDILSGLKTRNVNIQKPSANETTNNDSMISASSLKDIQNTNIPHKSSKKRNKSDKNIVSLDI
jgi:hypothetical protein